MSGFPTDAMPGNFPRNDDAPRHHVHNSNDPLPGSHADQQPAEAPQLPDRNPPQEEAMYHTQGHNASNSERPFDVRPTRAGMCRCPFPEAITDVKLILRNIQGVLLLPAMTISPRGSLAL
jgi:hypothetical protein